MRLAPPCKAINFSGKDIYGEPIRLSDYKGKRVMLSFFRDAACPFCNFRVYELTNNYKEWQDEGLEIIAVFSSTAKEVRQYVARYPRPFRLIADPDLALYGRYGVEKSALALLKAFIFKMPRIIKGIIKGGRPKPNPHVRLVPADFLLDVDGTVSEVWYGKDTADHIPLDHIQAFIESPVTDDGEISQLREENKRLRRALTAQYKNKV